MKPLFESGVNSEKIIGNGEKADYDEKDYKILKELTKNARVSIVDIASKIKLTPKPIKLI